MFMCEHQLWNFGHRFLQILPCFSRLILPLPRYLRRFWCQSQLNGEARKPPSTDDASSTAKQAACDLSELLECGGRMITICISTLEAMLLFVELIGDFRIRNIK